MLARSEAGIKETTEDFVHRMLDKYPEILDRYVQKGGAPPSMWARLKGRFAPSAPAESEVETK